MKDKIHIITQSPSSVGIETLCSLYAVYRQSIIIIIVI